MTNLEKNRRINQTIVETQHLLDKATKKYNDSVTCLKMDIEENKEPGNNISANRLWVKHCNDDKARVVELQNHITYLKDMLVD